MRVNPHIFRAYDLRGLVDKDLTPEVVFHLGRAFGTYLKRHGLDEAVVGRDCRKTGLIYSQKIIEGLNWSGIDVVDIGMQLVGTFYWSQYHFKRPGGVYVTASHNPKEFNGFKFANDYSETLVTEGMMELRQLVEKEDYEKGEKIGKVRTENIQAAYFVELLKHLHVTKKFKVVVDPSCSTAGSIAPELLRQAGCEVVGCNITIDPSFPLGTPDPTETKVMERLRQEVLEAKADIGFTYDADGDRIGIIDEKGNYVWNDVLVALFASDVLKDHPGATIVFNILCSRAVPETIEREGGKPFMWRTGHSFIKKKGSEIGSAFGGELSGHFFFSADFYNHDDGLYSSLRLLQYLSRTGQKLSEAVAALPKYISSPEIKVFCADEEKVTMIKHLSQILKRDYPDAEIIDDERAADGLRLELPDAMFVVRYSQNGPYLTVKFEAKSDSLYKKLREYIANLLRGQPQIDWKHSINVNVAALAD